MRASKEIAVKFIETGRLSLGSFNAAFRQIYTTIKDTVEEKKEA
ncbi:conjugal transfer protein TraB [Dethiosulfatarculus sandiegensis]|uniref:Conjugal transfer protein TraB n=1 Tax=Dethiosulfatarculus sandiegensis TaxID=1429043 RepID=A0A0D2HLF1_9BACT|nr:conjugal transfer protein TraB [Dethiosulfatarculus sandiegensis]